MASLTTITTTTIPTTTDSQKHAVTAQQQKALVLGRRERKKTVSFCDDVSEASTTVSDAIDFLINLSDDDSGEESKPVPRIRRESERSNCSLQDGRIRSVSFLLPLEACKEEERTIISVPELSCLTLPTTDDSSPLTCIVPVQKETLEGAVEISMEPSVITKKDGSRVIITDKGAKHLPPAKKVKPKDILILKIFTAISMIFFLPVGIFVLFLTIKTLKEYKAGLTSGDMDKTYVWKKRAENLITVCIFCGLILWGAVIVVVKQLKDPHTPALSHD